MLPDTTGADLEQQLGQGQVTAAAGGGLLVPRYPAAAPHQLPAAADFLSQPGPKSLSDNSSAAESPVNDEHTVTSLSTPINIAY